MFNYCQAYVCLFFESIIVQSELRRTTCAGVAHLVSGISWQTSGPGPPPISAQLSRPSVFVYLINKFQRYCLVQRGSEPNEVTTRATVVAPGATLLTCMEVEFATRLTQLSGNTTPRSTSSSQLNLFGFPCICSSEVPHESSSLTRGAPSCSETICAATSIPVIAESSESMQR